MEPTMTAADVAYVRENFVDLDSAASAAGLTLAEAERLIEAGRVAGPAYVLPGGTAMVARDHFALLGEATAADLVRSMFGRRYTEAGGDPAAVDEEWEAYLSGAYAVCLRNVTPETIVRKGALVDAIDRMLAEPSPEEETWRQRLRAAVDELDRLERPFAPDYDRARWGPTSRDRCITASRARYPDVFAFSSTPT